MPFKCPRTKPNKTAHSGVQPFHEIKKKAPFNNQTNEKKKKNTINWQSIFYENIFERYLEKTT